MLNKEYINFLAVLLFKYRTKHLWVIVISSLLIAIICSFFFLTSSIKNVNFDNLESQPDYVLQKYRAGKVEDIPSQWLEGFEKLSGVESVTPRIYGMHFYDPSETYFMLVGIDFSDSNALKEFKELFPSIEVTEFLKRDNMIMGNGVKKLFEYYEYKDYYIFRPPDKGKQKVYFHSEIPKSSQVYTNDMVLMDINLVRKILGMKENYFTDIAININNTVDKDEVKIALILSHFNMRIIDKDELKKHYENLFNYKGGVFLALYIFSLITFLLILYQRYSTVVYSDAKEIVILRISGWKISDVIYLKLMENFLIAFISYMLGVIFAYFYVYVLNAPLLKGIFLGFNNLSNTTTFTPAVELSSLISVFFIFVIPFILVIIIPVWRISVREPVEVMR